MKNAARWARRHTITLAISIVALACLRVVSCRPLANAPQVASDVEDTKVEVPQGVEMIYWEQQKGFPPEQSRLTLWADGRSEIFLRKYFNSPLKVKAGWKIVTENPNEPCDRKEVQRLNPLSQEEAKRRFDDALAAGICDLKTFEMRYTDGGGTGIGVQINGRLEAKHIPFFVREHKDEKGSLNHRRYLAVERIMSDFDRDPKEPDNVTVVPTTSLPVRLS